MVIVTAITSTGVVAHASMLPLEEVNACLVLNGIEDQELKNVPLADVLNGLVNSNNEKVTIPTSATDVWMYVKNENNEEVLDSYNHYLISENPDLDLSTVAGITSYTLELIVGSGGQLNVGNVRYIIKVYVTNSISSEYNFELYKKDNNGVRSKVEPIEKTTAVGDLILTTIEATSFTLLDYDSSADYYIAMSETAEEHPNVKIKVYNGNAQNLLYKMMFGLDSDVTDITSEIMHQDMTQKNAGYTGDFTDPNNSNGFLLIEYTILDWNTGIEKTQYSLRAFAIDSSYSNGYLYSYENGQKKDVACFSTREAIVESMKINPDASVSDVSGIHGIYYMLNEGYSASQEYYVALELFADNYGENTANHVEKAVVGSFSSLEEVTDEADIQQQLLAKDTNIGYKANYNYQDNGQFFTVFLDDGTVWKCNVRVMEYDPQYDPNYMRSFTDKPIIGEADPWFNVTGAIDSNGNKYSVDNGNAYIVENGKNINMDTYYGYGYQTVFIKDDNDSDIDLSNMKPIFNYTDENRLYAVSEDTGNRIDEDHTRDFGEDNQQYTLVFDDNENQKRNYWITYKKLNNNGPELYVLGPQEREVIFDDYFGDKHDILIANVGNAPLTNLSVELRDAENVKLDGYWTVGGENNDTLAAFSTTSKTTQYGELPNMGKIRLVPDGNGEVKGTVVIKAGEVGNEQEVVISLNGTVKTPEIITDNLSDAVKYVPYQYIIATDNIHDNIREEFEIVEGEQALPKGLVFNKKTGEISGVPQVPDNNAEYEDYEFTIKVNCFNEGENEPFDSVSKKFKLRVNSNTNDNVYNASDEGYTIKEHIGTETENSHEFVLENIEEDQLFVSNGNYGEFIDLWLNGEKLYYNENDLDNSDYTKEEGSTRITIKSETFENKASKDKPNTIAMEFRNDDNEVNRTAQNFNIKNTPSVDVSVENVISLINAIPSNVTLSDRGKVQTARNAYNALSTTQKKSVTNYSNLTDAESVISKLETDESNKAAANKVVTLINSLPNTISISDKSLVESARSTYDALTPVQKNYVSNYNKLLAAENAIKTLEKNRAAAQPVISLINDIPTSITLDCKDEVTAARNAYNKLTSEQKEYVTNYKKLQAAETAIETLETEEQERAKDRAAAQPVIDLINAIPSTVTLESEDTITSARNAYNLLLSNQKGYVTNYQILTKAEDKLAELKKETDGKTVNMVCYVVDKNGKALVDYLVEIHSAVQQSKTDENGFARFSNVEMTNHKIIIKNAEGKELSNKLFKITEGNSLSLNGDEIVAQAGSIFTLAIKADEESINFLNVESGDKAPKLENKDDKPLSIDISDSTKDEKNIDDIKIDISDSANGGTSANTSLGSVATGDRNTMYAWYVLLVCSWTTLVVMFVHNRRKRNR